MKPLPFEAGAAVGAPGSPLRIAMISEHASPLAPLGGRDSGGQNVYVAQVARHLGRLGHRVDVFTRRDSPTLPRVVELADGVRVIPVDAGPPAPLAKESLLPLMPAFTRVVAAHAVRERYDLAHANFFMSGLVAAELKRELGVPFAVTFHALGKVRRQHQGQADGFPDERFAIEERIVREADVIVAECPQDELDLMTLYSADPEKLVMVPCGFDPGEFWPGGRAEARAALGLGDGDRVILQLGRMVPRKGVDNVVRALARLPGDMRARLVVVGGESRRPDPALTPEIGRLMAVARDEGVADRVTFVGSRARGELRDYYVAADVFVSTPWYEPFGITPLEAMACGVPVIGANVGGIAHTVAHGETGYLVPPNDPDALAEKLALVLSQPRLARRLAQLGLQRVHAMFTWEKVAARLAVAFTAATGRRPAAAPTAAVATVDRGFDDLLAVLSRAKTCLRDDIVRAADLVSAAFARGGKVLVCGNGGSATDAQHFAAELVGRFLAPDRAALPVIALNADTAVLTAWANDVGYADVFARQVRAYGRPGDVVFGISTSGRSANVVAALKAARDCGLHTFALLGGTGGEAGDLADCALIVPSPDTQRIQEVHTLALHLICELVEARVTPLS
ncbi:phosphoheptose isomerase [Nannocystis exedens]|uniref:Phosphoheptose isomerase n=1 Tax=Nannocystis exedens TaxID=54 RepID=A0A1I2IC94_9BACT|nr:glycosyltransferase [Nannocystis exedens]PCC67152.1 phosphoheptose isomerase [Nannocystis exedens]SFF39989.1 phosphoheptose isomerase [Nannocystis exedens]